MSFSELLFLLKHYFESENSYYPISEGFQGKSMLLKAIIDVYTGIPLERVFKYYKLMRKKKHPNIIDKRKRKVTFEHGSVHRGGIAKEL